MSRVLSTSRLLLRPLEAGDRDLYCQLYTDTAVMARIAAPLSAEAAHHAFQLALELNVSNPPRVRYWVARESPASHGCGLLALIYDEGPERSAEMGILLLPSMQGKGHATEALAALADHAFSELGLRRLWTRHRDDNLAVVHLMRILGFQRVPSAVKGEVRWSMERGHWLGDRPRHAGFASPESDG